MQKMHVHEEYGFGRGDGLDLRVPSWVRWDNSL